MTWGAQNFPPVPYATTTDSHPSWLLALWPWHPRQIDRSHCVIARIRFRPNLLILVSSEVWATVFCKENKLNTCVMRPHSLVLSGPLLVALASAFATGPHLNTPEKRADSPYANAPIPDPSQCPTGTHVIAASGKGSANVGGYGLIISLVNSILDSVPDSTQVALTYPKQTESNFVSLTTTGTSNLMSYLEDYNTACPDTKITLLGYSSVSTTGISLRLTAFVR